MLRIPEAIYNEIIIHAREGMPLEVCGILGGTDGRISDIYRIANVDASSEHFTMDPEEQIEVMMSLESRGLETVAFYHSHPKGPDFPSSEDIRLAFYPDVLSVIVSLADPERPVLKSFRIGVGQVEPVPIRILPA
jgi:proteasome lid subunit RPN8/RPN11